LDKYSEAAVRSEGCGEQCDPVPLIELGPNACHWPVSGHGIAPPFCGARRGGLIHVDGRPVSSVPSNPALGWLQANEDIGYCAH